MFRLFVRIACLLGAAVLLFAVLTVRLFVLPVKGEATKADAVVLIDDGRGIRLRTAVRLVEDGVAPVLVISHRPDRPKDCLSNLSNVTVFCFSPDPDSTQGEAMAIGRLVREQGWTSLVFVTDPPHVFRSRFRLERCTDANVKLVAVTSHLPEYEWKVRIQYEWAGSLQAIFLKRSCASS